MAREFGYVDVDGNLSRVGSPLYGGGHAHQVSSQQ
jgi:hypothetical protein